MLGFIKKSLKYRLVMLMASIGLAVVVAIGAAAYWQSQRALKDSVGQTFQAIAQSTMDKIDRNLFERYGDVQAFATNVLAVERLSGRGSERELTRFINTMMTSYGIYDMMILVDSRGRIVAANTVSNEGKPLDTHRLAGMSVDQTEWFRACEDGKIQAGQSYYSDPHVDPITDGVYGEARPVMNYASPVRGENGALLGVWCNSASVHRIVEQITDETTEHQRSHGFPSFRLTVIDKSGLILDDANESEILKTNLAEQDRAECVQRVLKGESGYTVETRAASGSTEVNGFTKSKGALGYLANGWGLLASASVDDALVSVAALRTMILVIGLLMLVATAAIATLLAKKIVDPLKSLAVASNRLSAGDADITVSVQSQDEVGQLAESFKAMIDNIKQQAHAANRIAAGDLSVTVNVRSEKDVLGKALRGAVASLQGLVGEMTTLSRAAVDGRLSTRGNAENFQGGYREIVQGVNNTLEAVVGPLNAAADRVDRISKGDIPPEITDNYNGDFNELKKNLNTCGAAVKAMVADAQMLSQAAVDGRLSARADASKHQGAFRTIVEGVNATLDAVIVPVQEGVSILAEMAKGDLTVSVTSDYKGDLALIKNSINSVVSSLGKAMSEVLEAVSATASASSEISSSTEQMAAGAQEQTSQAGEVAGAVEEMTKTILENSRNAGTAAETAKLARVSAEQGGQAVQDTINGMKRIATVVNQSAATVRELGKSSDQIGEIISVIDDIADQTNLLALNAAIEAARAGEQGRGFAVVADEVRKLAERTTRATKEIASMIKRIQSETAGAVSSMEVGTKEVEEGIGLADKAGISLQEIVGVSQKVTDMVTQIAAASEQQSSASEQISKNVEGISKVTSETAQGTQQIARAAEDLNRLTENLQRLVGQFKLRDDLQASHASAESGVVRHMRPTLAVGAEGSLVLHEGRGLS